ncbi:hypothetical protein BJY01DRAFT_214386 [Aspergillus pseudoustus]|uniref:LTD domain-containing protein n=1 Tax=Aspergillus pseudoustus TaxID=1810923 RepID=A0ABR4JZS4_9EURO
MPLGNYGVWKAHPVKYDVERQARKPHLTLYFRDNGGGNSHAAINIKSGDQESRLVYWVNEDMNDHPLETALSGLKTGFHRLDDSDTEPDPSGLRLDYIRGNLFDVNAGRILPHDIHRPNNDIIDVLEPRLKQAIYEGAAVYIYGEQYHSKDGIHNVHMNQGNTSIPRYSGENGVFQDGALIFHFPETDKWIGLFFAFASQAVHTSEDEGRAILLSRVTWKDLLLDDLIENSVAIRRALVNPPQGQQQQFVTLTNLTDRKLSLARWKIRNSEWAQQVLPKGAALDARATEDFAIPHCQLSTAGDTITLLNRDALKVAGVSYSSRMQKGPIVFAG